LHRHVRPRILPVLKPVEDPELGSRQVGVEDGNTSPFLVTIYL
jgi:hypothetical protein